MNTTISLKYPFHSTIEKKSSVVLLAKNANVTKNLPELFYWGTLHNTNLVVKSLITISKTIRSNFRPKSRVFEVDPIVTTENNTIRFEGFSSCCGVYSRIDIFEPGQSGEFLFNGTTNVDFNDLLLRAFQQLSSSSKFVLSIGKAEVGFHFDQSSYFEKRVKLPINWIKGLSSVQVYLSMSTPIYDLNKSEAISLFSTLTKTQLPLFLIKAAAGYSFVMSPEKDSLRIGGASRLLVLKELVPHIDKLIIYKEKEERSITFVLRMKELIYTFSMTRELDHGFSGNAAIQEYLIEDVNHSILKFYEIETNKDIDNISAKRNRSSKIIADDELETSSTILASLGLLGYDNCQGRYYKRELPFDLSKISKLNPRYVDAKNLILDKLTKVKSLEKDNIELVVEGSFGKYLVSIKNQKYMCTCPWFKRNHSFRGLCKHLIAAKILMKNDG